MTTTFNRDELKLISRALNFYGDHPEYMSEDRYVTEPVEAKSLATRIYRENFRIGMENEPPRPLPSQDYNEYLIDQDGNAQHVVVDIASAGGKRQIVRFTNVPMHHVHAAIALLNDDGQDALPAAENNPQAQVNYLYGKDADGNPLVTESGTTPERMTPYDKMLFNAEYAKNQALKAMFNSDVANQENPLKKFYPPYVAPGTKEFTKDGLFQQGIIMTNQCAECGAYVANRDKHVTWHNKTLP